MNWPGIRTMAAPATLDSFDVLLNAAAVIKASGFDGTPVAILSPMTELAFNALKDTQGNPLTRPEGLPRILISDQLPTSGTAPAIVADSVVFAPSAAAVVRRRDATIDVDRTGTYFQNDSAGVRIRARLDLVVGRPTGVVKITGLPAAVPTEASAARTKRSS
jgi:HK97 family phage major capsid protein